MPAAASLHPVETGVAESLLRSLDAQLHSWPESFKPNPNLKRQLEKRAQVVPQNGRLDWAHAEALSFASLLAQGIPLRMSGQDAERGTFSHRHLVLHDSETAETYAPIAHLEEAEVSIEIYNSPLSELAVVGFEYGYSVVAPRALTLWEAQFGDFVNGAQVVLDQFLIAGREKWGQESRLTLLLPHGYEGQGPEHSSARIERFLQSAAENNIRVANCTTPAQYFHLLRRQALLTERSPLIVATPKSLLRHPRATSAFQELIEGRFRLVLDDADADDAGTITRVVLCSGKVYYDLIAGRETAGTADRVAIARVEQLYPFPAESIRKVVDRYPAAEILWVQEEPANMGAWPFMQARLNDVSGERTVGYAGRPERASPAEGYANDHEFEQQRIVREAVAEPPKPARAARSRGRSRQRAD
jgi:2-oxoglutarate dehydrogenase E1 component